MYNKKQKDVIQDITEQTLLTLDGVAEEISKQTVQEEVDNFIAERTLKENPDEVIAIANKVKEYKKGDKTNFGVVVAVSPSSITFKSKDVPNDPGGIGTKIVFNARKMGSKDYVLSSLSKINESMYEYSNTMEDDEEVDDMQERDAKDDSDFELLIGQKVNYRIQGHSSKEVIAAINKTQQGNYEVKFVSDSVQGGHPVLSMKQLYELLSDDEVRFSGSNGMTVLKLQEADDQEVEVEVEEETIESLAAKLELTDEQVETLAAKCNEKYGDEECDAVLLDMLKIVAIPTDEEHKSAMMELIVNGDFDALEAHIAEMKDKEESEMTEGTNKQEREKLQSILKSKKFLELDEINDENQIEDLLKLQRQGFIPDDIESIYEYGNVPQYGAAVIFYPDDDGITILKGRKNIGTNIKALLKDMSIFDDVFIGDDMNERMSDSEKMQGASKKKFETIAKKLGLSSGAQNLLAKGATDNYPSDFGDPWAYNRLSSIVDLIKKIENRPKFKDEYKDLIAYAKKGDFKSLDNDEFIRKALKPSGFTDMEEESEMNEAAGDFKTLEAYVTVVEKLLGKKASNIEKGTNKYSDDHYNYITFQISQSSFQVQGKSDGVYVGFMGLGVYSKSDIRGPFDSPKDFENEMTKEESNMKVDTTDIDELVKDEEGLTEGFKEKASIIFEAAVASKVKATKSLLKEQYATRLQEEVEVLKENLVEKIDSYLTYAVETWVNDNKVAVESTLRTEITESFIGSLKNIFTEHYIEVPESKVNFVANMEAQLSSLKEQVDKKGRIANALADRVEKLTRQKVIAEASTGLADTQIAKLTELVQDVEFINENTFAKKVGTIREFYINNRNSKHTLNENVDDNASFISKETIVENLIEGDSVSPSMQNYLSAMSRMNKATTANLVM